MIRLDRYNLILKAAHLYYIDNKTQAEISEILRISRPTINKLLREARESGIVKITINNTRGGENFVERELELREELGLREVMIVNPASTSQKAIDLSIGEQAANYLMSTLRSGATIGLSSGKTVLRMNEHLHSTGVLKNLSFIPLEGGIDTEDGNYSNILSNFLCEQMASLFKNSTIAMVLAPLVAQSEEEAAILFRSKNIQRVFNRMEDMDIAIVGIDSDPENSTLLLLDRTLKEYRADMVKAGIVGNVCARHYTEDGELNVMDIERNIIAIQPEGLQKIPLVLGIAGGVHKIRSIIGGARAKLFNTLITDIHTANAVSARLKGTR
ncbi:MAG: hypothetical protein LBR44_07320 [Clostridiales Family XIII bacterium]|jgi:deoxyribonucleoside regulator|nr:hypothetical protein [Clostridiales Family XIII bacterium]